ncbi:MAG: tail fiber domain-containing protein, partial [Bacteroidota bacterium]
NIVSGNVFVGSASGKKNTTGSGNSFFGDNSGREDTTGYANSFFGSYAGQLNNGDYNSFFGNAAGSNNRTGFYNTFIGGTAGGGTTSGNNNAAIGFQALRLNASGSRNIALGGNSLRNLTSDSLNIAIGDSAAYNCLSSRNVFIGSKSGRNLLSGQGNTIIGDNAAYSVSNGDYNVIIGNDAAKLNTAYSFRAVVIGALAGDSSVANWSTVIGNLAGTRNTRSGNTMLGSSAGEYNTTGTVTLLGDNAGRYNTTGTITAVGYYSGNHNTTGNANTFMGMYSGSANTKGTANSFYGSASGTANDSGSYNSYFGLSTGANNTGGSYNSIFGTFAGSSLKASNLNTVVGSSAFISSDTSTGNSVLGAYAGFSLVKGNYNSIFGNSTGIGLKNGSENILVGYQAALGDTSNFSVAIGSTAGSKGNENIFIGHLAGGNLVTTISSTNSVCIGSLAGYFKHTSNSTMLGYNSNVLSDGLDNATAIGANARVDVSNAMVLGNSNVNVGIGVTDPTHAKLTLYADASNGTPLSIFGYGQNGISIQQNWPTIGYNQYRDLASANSAKYMGTGYAWVNTMEPTTGNIYWNSMPYGTSNAAVGTETNRMTLTNSGYLGLNTAPHAVLQVDNQLNNRRIVLWEQNNNSTEFFGFGINSGVLRYQVPNANSGNAHVFYAANSTLLTIFGNGNATLAGILTQLSDARLKKDITPVTSALSGLKKLNAYNYYWIDETKDKEQQTGLLAQEVEKVFPQLVKKNEQGLLSVNYSGFTPLLIKGMQEQQQMIDELKKEVDELRQMIKNMAADK